MYEHELWNFIKQHKEHMMQVMRIKTETQIRMIMPTAEQIIFEKK